MEGKTKLPERIKGEFRLNYNPLHKAYPSAEAPIATALFPAVGLSCRYKYLSPILHKGGTGYDFV